MEESSIVYGIEASAMAGARVARLGTPRSRESDRLRRERDTCLRRLLDKY
jgi:hypothetical protein